MAKKTVYRYRMSPIDEESFSKLKWSAASSKSWQGKYGYDDSVSTFSTYCTFSIGGETIYGSGSYANGEVKTGDWGLNSPFFSFSGVNTMKEISVSSREADFYNIKFESGGHGKVSNAGGLIEADPWNVECEAIPDKSYMFLQWNCNDGTISKQNPIKVPKNRDVKYTAIFGVDGYNISVSSTPNGSASVLYNGGSYSNRTVRVARNHRFSLVATTNKNQTFERWEITIGSSTTQNTNKTINNIEPNSNASYHAVFSQNWVKAQTKYTNLCDVYVDEAGVSYKRIPANRRFSVFCTIHEPNKYSFGGWYPDNRMVAPARSMSNPCTSSFSGTNTEYWAKIVDRKFTLGIEGSHYGNATIWMDGKIVSPSFFPVPGKVVGLSAEVCNGTWTSQDPDSRPGQFLGWFKNGQPLTTELNYEFVVPDNYSHTVFTAKFIEAKAWNLSVTSGDIIEGQPDIVSPSINGNSTFVASGISANKPANTKYYSGHIKVNANPAAGWEVSAWHIDTVEVANPDGSAFRGNVLDFVLSDNTEVQAIYCISTNLINVHIDHASANKGSVDILHKVGDAWKKVDDGQVKYGEECRVTFKAISENDVVALVQRGDVDITSQVGTLSTGERFFDFASTNDEVFTIKFGTTVTVSAKKVTDSGTSVLDNTFVHIGKNPENFESGNTLIVPFGEKFFISATETADTFFDSWCRVSSSPDYLQKPIIGKGMLSEFTLSEDDSQFETSISNPEFVAKFTATKKQYYVKLTNFGDTNYGELDMISLRGESDVVEINEAEFNQGIATSDLDEHSSGGGTDTPSGPHDEPGVYGRDRFYKVSQNTPVSISIDLLNEHLYRFEEYTASVYKDKVETNPPVHISFDKNCEYPISAHQIITVKYDTNLPQMLKIQNHEDGENGGGSFYANPFGSDTESGEYLFSSTYAPDTVVTLIASPVNGYKFDGWYLDGVKQSSSTSYSYKIEGSVTFLAKFVKDTDAIFEWEGSNENKSLIWRSRRHMSSQPINLTSGMVCADGYPVKLSVNHASSPNPSDNAWRKAEIIVNNQDPRRLPMLRPEKYVEIQVISKHPVLRIGASSSMGGLLGE